MCNKEMLFSHPLSVFDDYAKSTHTTQKLPKSKNVDVVLVPIPLNFHVDLVHHIRTKPIEAPGDLKHWSKNCFYGFPCIC